jgi:SAM-dependent methyltransferase
MPTETGIFTPEEAKAGHLFSYRLAQLMGEIFSKKMPVIDMGCGPGSYLRYLQDIGFFSTIGIEGTKEQDFEVDDSTIYIADLTTPYKSHETSKGNVICLEVGEHIPELYTEIFLDNICQAVKPGQFLFMSWAVPGQDGTGHVNCQPNQWVKDQLFYRGFVFSESLTELAREVVENHLAYFKETVLIFSKRL